MKPDAVPSWRRHWFALIHLVVREWRLLVRNPQGLIALFLMPSAFVLIMSFTLKNTLITDVAPPTTGWVNEDATPAGVTWSREWLARPFVRSFSSRDALRDALKSNQVSAGIVVKDGVFPAHGRPRIDAIEMWLGNRVQPAAAARIRAELNYSLLQAQMKIAAAEAGPFASILLSGSSSAESLPQRDGLLIRYLYEIESGRKMTAVQQSVPAWLVFGMFFVVIPIAGVLIQERNDRTLARLITFGVSPALILAGKLIAFMLLNWLQLALMLLVGRVLVPLLGGDTLNLDVAPGWFVLIVFATSAAATSLGLLIAARARSFEQAAALGGGLNVILAAIAGVMVPRMLMPPALQTVSERSPMGWALDGMQSVFLGDPAAAFIVPRASLLFAFAACCLLLSWRPIRDQDGG